MLHAICCGATPVQAELPSSSSPPPKAETEEDRRKGSPDPDGKGGDDADGAAGKISVSGFANKGGISSLFLPHAQFHSFFL